MPFPAAFEWTVTAFGPQLPATATSCSEPKQEAQVFFGGFVFPRSRGGVKVRVARVGDVSKPQRCLENAVEARVNVRPEGERRAALHASEVPLARLERQLLLVARIDEMKLSVYN